MRTGRTVVDMVWLAVCAALLVGGLGGCSSQEKEKPELLVFAATSLTNALGEINRMFEAQGDADVSVSYGGSQMLAQQIASGAPADLFITAGDFPMRFLGGKGLVERQAVGLVSNKLVAVTRSGAARLDSMEQLNTHLVKRIAMADPDLAPAGGYARESLVRLGLWNDLQEKLIIGADVRVTLAYLEAGNVDVALVYQTDAATARDVVVMDIVGPESHSRIVYPAAVMRGSEQKPVAKAFLGFLQSEAALEVFVKHGFQPLAP